MAWRVMGSDFPVGRKATRTLDDEMEQHYVEPGSTRCACEADVSGGGDKVTRHFIEVAYLLGRLESR